MGYDKIRVDLVQPVDESFKHLLFIIENAESLIIFHFLLHIIRQRNRVEFPDHGEVLEFLFFGGTILIHFLLNYA